MIFRKYITDTDFSGFISGLLKSHPNQQRERSSKMALKLSTEETNLRKLTRSPIPMNFVKKKNGSWNHQDWLDFLDYLKGKSYFPIDTDRVGLLLEEKKAQYLALKNK